MWAILRTPRWAIATLVVVTVCAVFASLGQWQLRRHSERQVENTVNAARLASESTDLQVLLDAAGDDLDSLEYRPVEVRGSYRPDDELLVRSQVANERPGFHVVTPLDTAVGTVLVNRGWVPLAAETPPVSAVPPPDGTVTVSGLIRLSQLRPSIGPVEPEGELSVIARIDLARLAAQFDDLAPVWIQATSPSEETLPIRLALPAVDDSGPHLPYAFQWYSFAIITAGGFGLLARRAARTAR
ncbi:MAG: SURF1 family protein [Acidimicrobiia bacterium]